MLIGLGHHGPVVFIQNFSLGIEAQETTKYW